MIDRCQFRSTLFVFDNVLNIEFFHAWKGFEQFNGQLRQLARLIAIKAISGFDVRVSLAFVLVLLLFMIVITRMLVRMFIVLSVKQRGGDTHFFHSAARFGVEAEQPSTVFQRGDSFVQRGMVGLRRRRMLEADDIRGRTSKFDVYFLTFERQIQHGDTVDVGAMLAVFPCVVVFMLLVRGCPGRDKRQWSKQRNS